MFLSQLMKHIWFLFLKVTSPDSDLPPEPDEVDVACSPSCPCKKNEKIKFNETTMSSEHRDRFFTTTKVSTVIMARVLTEGGGLLLELKA